TRESGFFYAFHPQAEISLFLPLNRLALRAISGVLACSALSHIQRPLKQIVPTAGRWRGAARTKKSFTDQNRTTPHPPAVFES
ncbi:hypothetical protein, partial [Raoultella ornithinolytica]|uniref:hypothetical protein n=1 Tax=Raoultella ornithinolytica TaxID=54291 RepID=UPI003F1D92D3